MIHKIFSFLVIACSIVSLFPQTLFAANEDNYFVVTAYYSPLPNQKHYLKGNYEDEKRLNGQGIAGASGKGVFSGMLAAPGKYSFGTKIYLEGLGVGVVEDRGGAIVPAGKRGYQHDRIDVWVGYGDEGLRRALYWGKRKVKGNVIAANTQTTLNYKTIPSPLWAANGLKKVSNIFHTPLGVGSDTHKVQELQNILQEVGMYNGEIDGKYNSKVIEAVYNFQKENNISVVPYSPGAGYWGTTTRNTFFKQYINGDLIPKEKTKEDNDILQLFEKPVISSSEIQSLQKVLTDIGNYQGKIDGKLDSIQSDILEYQLLHNIIANKNEPGAGTFGPKTRAAMKEDYVLFLEHKERQQELQIMYEELEEASFLEAQDILKEIQSPQYGQIGTNIRTFQVWMRNIGYFTYKDTAIFGAKTKNSILDFQKDMQIIENSHDIGAGIFGPKTKQAFLKEIQHFLLQEKLKQEGIFEEIQALNKTQESDTKTLSRDIPITITTI